MINDRHLRIHLNISVILKLTFWKSIVLGARGKVWSSREMSCELRLQWKMILSVSLCFIFSGKSGAENHKLNGKLKSKGLEPGLLVPQIRAVTVRIHSWILCWNWQKENSMKNVAGASRGISKDYLAKLQAWQAVHSFGRKTSSLMNC